MHTGKTVLISLLSASALLTGCSKSSTPTAGPTLDAPTLLKDSANTIRGEQSVHIAIDVTGKIPQMPVNKLAGEMTLTPAVAAQGTTDIPGMGLSDVKFVVVDGDLWAALTAGAPMSNFGPAAKIYDISAILKPDTGLANILSNCANPKTEGTEEVNGVSTTKVACSVSAEAVNKIAPKLAVTGPVPGTSWIANDNKHELVATQLEVTPGNIMKMTLSDWGKPVTVSKPTGQ